MNVSELSLVIPCHNEEKNLRPLLSAIHETLDPLGLDYEVVITDDCSTDNSWSVLKELAATPSSAGPPRESPASQRSPVECNRLPHPSAVGPTDREVSGGVPSLTS